MPFYDAPDSPDEYLFTLEETIAYCNGEIAESRPAPIGGDTLNGVVGFLTTYTPLVPTRNTALGDRTREVGEADTAQSFLEETARDFIAVLKRRTRRKRHNVAVLINHGLNSEGAVPAMYSWADLKTAVEKLLAGDTQSTATYGAMANPSAAELLAAFNAAKDERADVAPKDTILQNAQTALDGMKAGAEFWISEIRFDALHFARREDEASKRRLLRKLGFKFKTLSGETPEDPGDEPTEPPTPPTPPPPPTE